MCRENTFFRPNLWIDFFFQLMNSDELFSLRGYKSYNKYIIGWNKENTAMRWIDNQRDDIPADCKYPGFEKHKNI